TKQRDFIERFQLPFKSADEKFPMSDNDPEIRVLAGASLVAKFESSDGLGEAAALLLCCGSFSGKRVAIVEDVVHVAREYLSGRSATLRRSPQIEPAKLVNVKTQLDKQTAKVRKAFKDASPLPDISDILGNAFDSLADFLAALTRRAEIAEQQQAMRQEESDVLWWLFAERSRDLSTPLSSLKWPAVTLVAAKEMADLTLAIPGPFSASVSR